MSTESSNIPSAAAAPNETPGAAQLQEAAAHPIPGSPQAAAEPDINIYTPEDQKDGTASPGRATSSAARRSTPTKVSTARNALPKQKQEENDKSHEKVITILEEQLKDMKAREERQIQEMQRMREENKNMGAELVKLNELLTKALDQKMKPEQTR